ncbi:hypothetical protein BTZ53_10800 [Vibrio parahaemolyticus]|nr:hypothetical protein BTZ53_10800 [Vibrio parahaemolyticus]
MRNTDISLHRFRDRLAITTDSSKTEYLTLEQVKSLYEKLGDFIEDMGKNPRFSQSEFAPVDITFDDGSY